MKTKIYDFGICKAMLIGDETNTDMYMQINSSNWHFCVGNQEPLEDWDDVESIKALCKEYFDVVKEDEDVINDYWEEKFKNLR